MPILKGYSCCLAVIFGLLVQPVRAEEAGSEVEIATLVTQLGDNEYIVREAAMKRLLAVGLAAKPQLQAAQSSDNTEIRFRAARLLTALEGRETSASVREFEARLSAFVTSEPSNRQPLAGWENYAPLSRDDKDSRQFFADMHRCEGKLLEVYGQAPDEAGRRLGAMFAMLGDRAFSIQLTAHSLAAILLVAGDERVVLPEPAAIKLCNLVQRHTDGTKLKNTAPVLQKLVLRWLDNNRQDTVEVAGNKMLVSFEQKGIPRFLKELANHEVQVQYRIHPLMGIMAFGTTEHIELLEPLLNDTTRCMNQVQMRDVVLLVLVQISRQEPANYRFTSNAKENLFFALWQGKDLFKDDADRAASLATWQAWSQADRPIRAKIKAFAADLDGTKGLSLPGWERFCNAAGNSAAARELFVQMYRYERELLETLEQHPDQVASLLDARTELSKPSFGRTLTLGSAAAFLLVGADSKLQLPLQSHAAVASIVESEPFIVAAAGSSFAAPLQVLKEAWEKRNQQLKARLALFVSNGRQTTTLPGWEAYRDRVGNDRLSRSFFVEMQHGASHLLEAYQQGPTEAAEAIAELLKTASESPVESSLQQSTLGAALLIAGDEKIMLPEATLTQLCGAILPERNYGRINFHQPILHKLLVHWLRRPIDPKLKEVAYQKARTVLTHRIKENLDLLIALALDPDMPAERRVTGLAGLALLGTDRHVAALEPLLQQAGGDLPNQTQLRDVALAVLVQLSGQPLQAYSFVEGYEPASLLVDPNGNLEQKFQTAKPADRAAALAKWKNWSDAEAAQRQRVQAFLEANDEEADLALPRWKRFQELVGSQPAARALFAEMQLAERELLEACEKQPEQVGPLFEQRCARQEWLMHQRGGLSIASLAALVLVASEEGIDFPERPIHVMSVMLMRHDVATDENCAKLRSLVDGWLQCPHENYPELWLARFGIAGRYDLKERALSMARSYFSERSKQEGVPIQQQAEFIAASAKWGDSAYLEIIEPLVKDERIVQEAHQTQPEIQLRDVALATVIHLQGQNLVHYRLKHITPDGYGHGLFHWNTAYFEDSEDRDWALAKHQSQTGEAEDATESQSPSAVKALEP